MAACGTIANRPNLVLPSLRELEHEELLEDLLEKIHALSAPQEALQQEPVLSHQYDVLRCDLLEIAVDLMRARPNLKGWAEKVMDEAGIAGIS